MKRAILRSSCLLAAALAIGACVHDDESDRPIRSARYEAPQPSPEIRDVQSRLRTLGAYSGPVDGLWGPETQAGVERFQRDHRLAITARLDDATMDALRDVTATDSIDVADTGDIRALQNRL